MKRSIYLEKLIEEYSEARKPVAKKTLSAVILLVVIAIAAYIGLPLLDYRAAPVGIMISLIFALIAIIFFIKYLRINAKIGDKIITKCTEEIEKNLKTGENFEVFDTDMISPAYGQHSINGIRVLVGHIFVLFVYFNSNGVRFKILRGDNLGNYDVHYFSEGGIGNDIGVDINDKTGKRVQSVMTQDKDELYKLLNAMEKIKHYANGEDVLEEQALNSEDDQFVGELKKKVQNTDRKGLIKVGTLGIVVGIFLCIAGNSSGQGFIYGGLALMVLSTVFIIGVNIRLKN